MSALVESLIFSLAKTLLEKHDLFYQPAPSQEFNQSMSILKANKLLNPNEVDQINKFRTARNQSIHQIFKGMSREEWNKNNKEVIELGKPIVEMLEKKIAAVVLVDKNK